MRNSKLIRRLSRLKETVSVPVWMMMAVNSNPPASLPADADRHFRGLLQEVGQVEQMRTRLGSLPPNWKLESTLL